MLVAYTSATSGNNLDLQIYIYKGLHMVTDKDNSDKLKTQVCIGNIHIKMYW